MQGEDGAGPGPSRDTTPARRARVGVACAAGRAAAALSRRLHRGGGSIIAGRVALALCPGILGDLARRHEVALVTGTNGKTTTSHLLAAAVADEGPIAHNASGSNMTDGAVNALLATPRAARAVLEIDELHVTEVLDACRPALLVVLNLSRDQLDRVSEVRATASALGARLAGHPETVVVANADDPLVVWAARTAASVVWVAAGWGWRGDSRSCPACGGYLVGSEVDPTTDPDPEWYCTDCTLRRPAVAWWLDRDRRPPTVHGPGGVTTDLRLAIPGGANESNAAMALAAAARLGVETRAAARRLSAIREVAGRYAVVRHGRHRLRLLLGKNPAGWREVVTVLEPGRPLLAVVNAREADGCDVSWLWDLPVDALAGRPLAVAGDRAADLGVRLSYADIPHHTHPDPVRALAGLPPGEVDVVANYTAFRDLVRRLPPAEPADPTVPAGRPEPDLEAARSGTSGRSGRARDSEPV